MSVSGLFVRSAAAINVGSDRDPSYVCSEEKDASRVLEADMLLYGCVLILCIGVGGFRRFLFLYSGLD